MRTAEDIKLDIADFDKKIRAKQKQINALEKEVDKLRAAQKALNTELYELKREEQTEKLLQSVFAVTKRNSTEETLSSFTYTTNLMDKFVNSKRRFLLFKHAFRIGAWRYVTLVVTKCRWDVRYHYSGLVMTDLKKAVGAHVTEDSLRYTREGSRLYPLYSELVAIGQKQMEKGEYIPFETPCMLGGQTNPDRGGYGWEYNGDTLVRQGKNYGETTKFLIVGIRVET